MENRKPSEIPQTNVPSLIAEVLKRRSDAEAVQLKAQEMSELIKSLFHHHRVKEEKPPEPKSEETQITLGNGQVIKGRTVPDSIFSSKELRRMDYRRRFGHNPSEYLHFTIEGQTTESDEDLQLTIEADGDSGNYFVTFTGLNEKLVVNDAGAYLESLQSEIVGEFIVGGHNASRPEWQSEITLERINQYEELIQFASVTGVPQIKEI